MTDNFAWLVATATISTVIGATTGILVCLFCSNTFNNDDARCKQRRRKRRHRTPNVRVVPLYKGPQTPQESDDPSPPLAVVRAPLLLSEGTAEQNGWIFDA